MIIVLKNGQVVEKGTHSELISKSGEYATLVSLHVSEHIKSTSLNSSNGISSFHECPESENHQQNFKSVNVKEIQPTDHNAALSKSSSTPTVWDLVKLNAPEWPYAMLGSVGAVLAGMEAPLFALGITYILTAFYSPDSAEINQQVQHVSLIFLGGALITIPIYLLQHYYFTLMGSTSLPVFAYQCSQVLFQSPSNSVFAGSWIYEEKKRQGKIL